MKVTARMKMATTIKIAPRPRPTQFALTDEVWISGAAAVLTAILQASLVAIENTVASKSLIASALESGTKEIDAGCVPVTVVHSQLAFVNVGAVFVRPRGWLRANL